VEVRSEERGGKAQRGKRQGGKEGSGRGDGIQGVAEHMGLVSGLRGEGWGRQREGSRKGEARVRGDGKRQSRGRKGGLDNGVWEQEWGGRGEAWGIDGK